MKEIIDKLDFTKIKKKKNGSAKGNIKRMRGKKKKTHRLGDSTSEKRTVI